MKQMFGTRSIRFFAIFPKCISPQLRLKPHRRLERVGGRICYNSYSELGLIRRHTHTHTNKIFFYSWIRFEPNVQSNSGSSVDPGFSVPRNVILGKANQGDVSIQSNNAKPVWTLRAQLAAAQPNVFVTR